MRRRTLIRGASDTIGTRAAVVDFAILKKNGVDGTATFEAVSRLAVKLRHQLDDPETQRLVRERHVLGASSAGIQEVILPGATELGFQTERKGLFASYSVAALRPDYFCVVNETGVLLEVERGKTIANNMDLLDLWVVSRLMWKSERRSSGVGTLAEPRHGDITIWPRGRSSFLEALSDCDFAPASS